MTIAWVFPGQGSQKIGMAKQIEDLPNTKARFSYASEQFERDLFEICELNSEPTNSLSDLNNTKNTQICLFLVESILLFKILLFTDLVQNWSTFSPLSFIKIFVSLKKEGLIVDQSITLTLFVNVFLCLCRFLVKTQTL